MMSNFISHGVTDFDIIGTSYYHEWHGATSISQVGSIVASLIQNYNKEIMVVEAGYPWTANWNDNANNILTAVNLGHSPLSRANQLKWMVDLTQAVVNNGGKGVIYWEPAWVSSSCSTQWAQGSHYENAAFFDFNNNLINDGGIGFMAHDYGISTTAKSKDRIDFKSYVVDKQLIIELDSTDWDASKKMQLVDLQGKIIRTANLTNPTMQMPILELPTGVYILSIIGDSHILGVKKLLIENL
jgi:arabinogalactan endo-1,4-beta-galactosidase